MVAVVGEPVGVVAVFDRGIRPARFRWRGRTYRVSSVTYRWSTTEGRKKKVHFSVTETGGSGLFELAYDTETMSWTLEKVDS